MQNNISNSDIIPLLGKKQGYLIGARAHAAEQDYIELALRRALQDLATIIRLPGCQTVCIQQKDNFVFKIVTKLTRSNSSF